MKNPAPGRGDVSSTTSVSKESLPPPTCAVNSQAPGPESITCGSSKVAADVFYLAPKGKYLLPDKNGDWKPGTRKDTKDYLIHQHGYQNCGRMSTGLPAIDQELLRIRREQAVDYANSLAGHRRGYYSNLNGKAILVTDEPKAIAPVRGHWRIIKEVVNGLLADRTHDQVIHFHGWMAETCKSLMSGKWRPGQILALVGRPSIGKSLLQSIITVVTGGREADPTLFLSRRTNFNGELFAAEHLRINDEVVSCGNYSTRQLHNGLKQIAANRTHKLHDKHNRGVDLPVFWRCTMSLNDGPGDVTLLPCMDDGMADKFMLLKCSAATLPMPTETVEQEAALWVAIVNEMPRYVYWLLHEFTLSEHLRSSRYGVRRFHHPDIVALLRARLPEEQLLRLIDSTCGIMFAEGRKKPWTGTAVELKSLLLRSPSNVQQEAKMFFVRNRNVAECLGRLAAKCPTRVKEAQNARSGQTWIIFPVWRDQDEGRAAHEPAWAKTSARLSTRM